MPGSGKTFFARKIASDSVKKKDSNILFIVPEQFTFETERALVKSGVRCPEANLEVFSFTSLCRRIFEETGGMPGRIADKGIKTAAMALAMSTAGDEKYFGRMRSLAQAAPGFVSLYSELRQNGVSWDELFAVSQRLENGSLRDKTAAIATVFSVYENIVRKGFSDSDRLIGEALKKSETGAFFGGKTVILDGFKGFTGDQMKLIEIIISHCDDMYITFCTDTIDRVDSDFLPFGNIKKTVAQLIVLAKRNSVEVAGIKHLNENFRFENSALQAAGEVLRRPLNVEEISEILDEKKTERAQNGEKERGGVAVECCADIYDEADRTACLICKELSLDQTLRCRDIAVIVRSADEYACALTAAFEKYGIPCYIDRRRPLYKEPLAVFLLGALCACVTGFDTPAIFSALKSTAADCTAEDAAELENYVRLWQVTKISLCEEFVRNPDGVCEGFSPEQRAKLERLNDTRKRVIEPVIALRNNLKAHSDGGEKIRDIYEFLKLSGAQKASVRLRESAEKDGRFDDAAAAVGAYNAVINLLDGMFYMLSGRNISLSELYSILLEAIRQSDMGQIPRGLDEVSVGSADRIRPGEPKVVFLLGANDSRFPRNVSKGGVLSDRERRSLKLMGLDVSDRSFEEICDEEFLFYSSALAPSQRLYVSYLASGAGNKEDLIPSENAKRLAVLAALSAGKSENNIDNNNNDNSNNDNNDAGIGGINTEHSLYGDNTAAKYADEYFEMSRCPLALAGDILKAIKSGDETPQSVKNAAGLLLESDSLTPQLKNAVKYGAENSPEKISSQSAEALFGKNMRLSPSGVEVFHKCRFQYFCRFGLRVYDVRPVDFDSLLTGTVVHYVLEQVFSPENAKRFIGADEQSVKKAVYQLADDYVLSHMGGMGDKTATFFYAFKRIKEHTASTAIRLLRELSLGEFHVLCCEKRIGKGENSIKPRVLSLKNGASICVEGVVDRIDVCEEQGKCFVRVLDYKTGRRVLDLDDVQNGLGLQMLIYLFSVGDVLSEKGKNVVPTGVLYVPARSEAVRSDEVLSGREMEEKSDKQAAFKGLILDDPEVIRVLGGGNNRFMPYGFKKDGSFKKGSSVASGEYFKELKEVTDSALINMGDRLLCGDIACDVLDSKEQDGCKWCDYSSVCKTAGKLPHRSVKEITRLKSLEHPEG